MEPRRVSLASERNPTRREDALLGRTPINDLFAFLTLFLGLVSGPQPVELQVGDKVASVELLVDGKSVGTLPGPPWRLTCDFGRGLVPHRLEAIARDKKGLELGVRTQWINLPRSPGEGSLVTENGTDGYPKSVRIHWQTLLQEEPQKITASFDNRPLKVETKGQVNLPAYDRARTHFLTVVLEFKQTGPYRLQTAFGGGFQTASGSQLTAVPILSADSTFPPAETLRDAFLHQDQPLRLVALEKGSGAVIVVRGQGAEPTLRRLATLTPGSSRVIPRGGEATGGQQTIEARSPEFATSDSSGTRSGPSLDRDARLRFLWPVARMVSNARLPAELFPLSREFADRDGNVPRLLTGMEFRVPVFSEQHLADAVAVAGLRACYGNYRRAVVLLVGRERDDASAYRPEMVRRYLQSLHVPLFVWCLDTDAQGTAEAAWGNVLPVTTTSQLTQAAVLLKNNLENQRVAWLEGVYLPQFITLAPAIERLRIAE